MTHVFAFRELREGVLKMCNYFDTLGVLIFQNAEVETVQVSDPAATTVDDLNPALP